MNNYDIVIVTLRFFMIKVIFDLQFLSDGGTHLQSKIKIYGLQVYKSDSFSNFALVIRPAEGLAKHVQSFKIFVSKFNKSYFVTFVGHCKKPIVKPISNTT